MKFNKWTILLTAALALASMPAKADPLGLIDVPIAVNMLTVSNATVNASGTNVYYQGIAGTYQTNGDYSFKVPQNSQLVIEPVCYAANNGTSNTTYNFSLDVESVNTDTNFTTSFPISSVVAMNGTSRVVGHTVINWTNTTGVARMRLDQTITAQTNNVTTEKVRIGVKNISTASY